MNLPKSVRLVEVGPRDGLQSESQILDLATKVHLVDALANCGLRYIEAGSFVSEKWVPQMASSADVFKQIQRKSGVIYAALTPNLRGLELATQYGVKEVAIFASASESFSQKNINCSIAQSIERFLPVIELAKQTDIKVRGYLSCVAGCPYEGMVSPVAVSSVAQSLIELGCYEVSLGDTIGVGNPLQIQQLLSLLMENIPVAQLAVHMHDTYGQALANIFAALQMGVAVIDSSVAGLGGCPYAKGASGNVATEDVVYMLQGLGIEHGVDLKQLAKVGAEISSALGKSTSSKVAKALGY